jgi:hypothetical protein
VSSCNLRFDQVRSGRRSAQCCWSAENLWVSDNSRLP